METNEGAEYAVKRGNINTESKMVKVICVGKLFLTYVSPLCCKGKLRMTWDRSTHVVIYIYIYIYIKVKWSCYRPGVAQRVGRGIALLFHDRGRKPWPQFTPGKDPVPILQEAGWAPGPVWTGGKSRPHRGSIPDRPARSQSLYRLS